MRKKMNATDERQARRMQADREELAERIARSLPRDGKVELQPGLVLSRVSSRPQAGSRHARAVVLRDRAGEQGRPARRGALPLRPGALPDQHGRTARRRPGGRRVARASRT